ncbi:ISL3 family transposase ISAli18 [Deinococcus carri]|uniref:ISL3 family transposase ISAli18 n=1 Tax=Deinococcus carri TaxID=1211323 RepID=A0ABP9W517_9DEIO
MVQHLSVILGGNAGAQLALKLPLPVSASTVLRSAQALTVTPARVPEIIGVDDFALRRGQVYGTVIVDLAQGKPIELLPDRSAETLAAWLQQHPHIKVISRDRSTEYEKGVRMGAPHAQQVLDRWHVIKNFREALERQLGRDRQTILAVCQAKVPVPPTPRTQSEELRYEAGQQARQGFFDEVRVLSKAGYSQRAITRRLKVSRGRVRHYLSAQAPPQRRHHHRRSSILDPFVPYLEERWAAGEDNAAALLRELREQGYPGSRKRVAQWVQVRRTHPAKNTPGPYRTTAVRKRSVSPQEQPPLLPGEADRNLTLRRLVWLMLPDETTLRSPDRELLTAMKAGCEAVSHAHGLAQAFMHLMRKRQPEALTGWVEQASSCGLPDLVTFARGLERDKDALEAALRLPWSNGPAEGVVNKIKLIKRQAYGRASFGLLRQRVLLAA